jgi:hypothetical protein
VQVRALFVVSVIALGLTRSGEALADAKQSCRDSYFASVIVEVVDSSGAPVTVGLVSLEGVGWLDRLDGSAQVISKGPHTLEVTVQGAEPQKKSIVIREGEKNRKIRIEVTRASNETDQPGPDPVHRIAPWVVGGVGVGALIASAVTGGLVVEAYSVTQEECNDETEECTQKGLDAQARGRLLGPVTTGLLIGGGALVTAGIVWLVLAPSRGEAKATSLFVSPVLSGEAQGVVLGGSW